MKVKNKGQPSQLALTCSKSTMETPGNCVKFVHLVPFVQFKKREKHPWGSVTLSKVAGF